MSLSLYDPDLRIFTSVDTGQQAQATLFLNILIELRVHTNILLAMNNGFINESADQLRADAVDSVLPKNLSMTVNTNINA